MTSIQSISQFHRLLSLPEPLYPLISVVHVEDIRFTGNGISGDFFLNFYSISLKKDVQAKMKYGQQYYDFDKGTMIFTAPKQIQSHEILETDGHHKRLGSGYVLFFHPDFLAGHALAATVRDYGFFSYAVHEALHLSEKEEENIMAIFQKIEQEYQYIDRHTQDIILAQLDLLLHYAMRFYERQFITRKKINNDLLTRMELLLQQYFEQDNGLEKGLPTVDYFAGQLHLSAHYLSDMLRILTGQSAQQHIHDKLIAKAKEYLSATQLSVAEIAYQLGFGYPQSFNKLFKKKTSLTPIQYRKAFFTS